MSTKQHILKCVLQDLLKPTTNPNGKCFTKNKNSFTIAALQHNLKEKTMFEFEKQYKEAIKNLENVADQTKEAYEVWFNCVVSMWKDLYSAKKK
jgi:hypothetical protein